MTRIPVFPERDMRRVAATVRDHERKPRHVEQPLDVPDQRGLQWRLGITCVDGDGLYPSATSNGFRWKPVRRKPESLATGHQEVETVESTEIRLGFAVDDRYIPEGTIVKACKIGGLWWLDPVSCRCDGPGITYGGVELLSVSSAEAEDYASAANGLARKIGLDVSGVNELVWPNGADRFGGMIGVVNGCTADAIRELWEPYRGGGPSFALPQLVFHDAPVMRAAVAALVPIAPIEEASSSSSEDQECTGRWLIALTDARRVLQEASFAPISDPELSSWEEVIDAQAIVANSPGILRPHTIAADRLKPEIDDPPPIGMTCGQFLEAAAWSVGGQWRLRSDSNLELQSPAQADDIEEENRDALESGGGSSSSSAPVEPIEGAFDETPIRPVAGIRLRVRKAYSAVPWPREEALVTANASEAIDEGLRWSPRTTALWEQSPVDGSPAQANAPELQALAELLVEDAEAWTGRIHRVVFAGFIHWEPSGRDRVVRWIERGECRTVIESLTPEDLPATLVHRSAVVPREASLAEAVTLASGSPGGTVLCELLATTGRPARQVVARLPSHPPGCSVCPDQNIWLDYNRSAGQWILPPWTTGAIVGCGGGCSESESESVSDSSPSDSSPSDSSPSDSSPSDSSPSDSSPSDSSPSDSSPSDSSPSDSSPSDSSPSESESDGPCCTEVNSGTYGDGTLSGASTGINMLFSGGSPDWLSDGTMPYYHPETDTTYNVSFAVNCNGSTAFLIVGNGLGPEGGPQIYEAASFSCSECPEGFNATFHDIQLTPGPNPIMDSLLMHAPCA